MYVFQIRAFTAAGYGNYSPRLDVATLEEATGKMFEGNYRLWFGFLFSITVILFPILRAIIWFKIIFIFKGEYICIIMYFVKVIQNNNLKFAVLFLSVRISSFISVSLIHTGFLFFGFWRFFFGKDEARNRNRICSIVY